MADIATAPHTERSQSSTSLAKLYHGTNGAVQQQDDLHDPKLDFCNAFWGQGDRGYEVVMARLRGAARTVDEMRAFWKERAQIEEDYAKRLSKLAKMSLGRDEVGDLAAALQGVQAETASQASYHLQVSTDLHAQVEQPTIDFGKRLATLKKGLQASIEKSYRNKGLQEGHVSKARESYETDCHKLNSYTANMQLVQGKELDKLQSQLERVRHTIVKNEQDFRNYANVLEQTSAKWENEWRTFLDHVQDIEEDRMALTKDIVWAYANAVSQVCVEDDSSCERIREKLETFEVSNDMANFVRGWGTGDSIPDAPRFVNYSAGEYPSQATFHPANFRRLSNKPPMSASPQPAHAGLPDEEHQYQPPAPPPVPKEEPFDPGMRNLSLEDKAPSVAGSAVGYDGGSNVSGQPFGGVAMPGMVMDTSRFGNMGPPPMPPSVVSDTSRGPGGYQGPPSPSGRNVDDEEDPMAKALAELRRDPPGPNTVRRGNSQRRPDSAFSQGGSMRGGSAVGRTASPAPSNHTRTSYTAPQQQQGRSSMDTSLIPPAGGHTAAALARSMADFKSPNRNSVNYANAGNSIVGEHPSRPSSPAARAPSPAMMMPPTQPETHPADEVLQQYQQAFPGERDRSRPASVYSSRSRAGSTSGSIAPAQPITSPREAFAGIGAGGAARSPSPQPGFHVPSPQPGSGGVLGAPNLGIALDERGGVAHDSMAEAYRSQYQEQQRQLQEQQEQQRRLAQQYGAAPYQQAAQPQSPPQQQQPQGFPDQHRQPSYQQHQSSLSQGSSHRQSQSYGQPPQQQQPQQGYQQQGYQPPQQQPAQQQYSQYGQPQQQQQQPGGYNQQSFSGQPQHQQQQQAQQGYRGYQNGPPDQHHRGSVHDQQPAQQQPQQQQRGSVYDQPPGYGGPQAQQQQHSAYQPPAQQVQKPRTPSPAPNVPPQNAEPTGQWSTSGEPVLFYVRAMYDYQAQSPAEFDFQEGDIIAVTSHPEDGWWSGELLDEARRTPGRKDFPSNFVTLF